MEENYKNNMFNRRIFKYLKEWKESKNRKPLILRGARQVGKTVAIKIFAKKEYSDFCYLNLEKAELRNLYQRVETVDDFFDTLHLSQKKEIIPEKTLLFIDEIQNCPNLISLLRFFYEEHPQIHVVAAGSLLEKIIEKEKTSMPVGRVNYAYLYPLDFFEYLEAIKETNLLSRLREIKPGENLKLISNFALQHLQNYLIVGGMPEAVAAYSQDRSFKKLDEIFSNLLTSYSDDILKYASTKEAKYIDHVLLNSHLKAGTTFRYSNFAGTNYTNKEVEPSLRNLEKVMLIRQISATKSISLPLESQLKRPKKLIHLDVGLVNYQSQLRQQILMAQDLNAVFRGRIAEQVVGQNIIAQGEIEKKDLYYWSLEKSKSVAEVDFCFNFSGKIIALEVKSGATGRLRSLFAFANKTNTKNYLLLRVHAGDFAWEHLTFQGNKYEILSVPIYLIPRIFEILDSLNLSS